MRFPSGLPRPWLALGLLVFSSVAVAGSWQAFLSPGPVGTSHDDFAGNCDACHLAFSGVPDEACLQCHTDLSKKIESKKGYHASVADQPCINCHTDHHGLDAPLTKEEPRRKFDHASTGFTLVGTHASADCTTCHTAPIGQMNASCGNCHEPDPHKSALGASCDTCHTPTGWTDELKTLAAHATPTTGGHRGLTCAECHIDGDHLDSQVACAECHRQAHGGTTSACEGCHEVAGWKPAEFDHGPCGCTFVGKHQTAPCLSCHPAFKFTETPELCSGCHSADRPHENLGECSGCHTALSWKDAAFDHNKKSKFPLAGKHLETDCASCHPTAGVFRGAPTACEGCHQERGDTTHGDFGACQTCHTVSGFSPSTFDHASTGFALTGRHAEAGCKDCHEGDDPSPR